MADEEEQIDPTESSGTPDEDASMAEGAESAPDAADASVDASGDETSGEDESSSAGSLAEDALKAAQAAIAGLSGGGDEDDASGNDEASSAEADIEAQMLAAMAEEAAASDANAGTPLDLPSFGTEGGASSGSSEIDLLSDVNLNVKIELGRTRMLIEDVLRLGDGAVVELDKLAGDPVDVYVNDRHIARGEVLVLNDNFCVRINEIVKPASDEARSA